MQFSNKCSSLTHLHVYRWYSAQGSDYRLSEDMLIPGNPNGTFCITATLDMPGMFVLAVLDDGVQQLYPITQGQGGDMRWFVDTEGVKDVKFRSLDKLVDYFTHNSGLTTRLSYPCPRIKGQR